MLGAIEQIEQEMIALKEAASVIAQDSCSTYASYLEVLGRAVRQQLVLASYHLCTQIYPQAFLGLSLIQRQQLQQTLQQLGQQAEQRLQNSLRLLAAPEGAQLEDPDQLSQAIAQLEQAIAEELQRASSEANLCLQSYGILSGTALEIVLKVAAKAEALGGAITGPPNLLTAVVETEEVDPSPRAPAIDFRPEAAQGPQLILEDQSQSASEESDLPQQRETTSAEIVAVYLRLGEIEFADSTVMRWRNRLRKLVAQLGELQREFTRKQQERTIAEAETAWHDSWSHPPVES